MKKLICIILFFFFISTYLFSQDFSLSIAYVNSEKSEDSYSINEAISINGMDLSYVVSYTGSIRNIHNDTTKTCVLTEQSIKNIKSTLKAKKLAKNISLVQESTKSKSFEKFCDIHIKINMDEKEYEIKIAGDVDELKHEKVYMDTMFFIKMIEKMADDC